MAGYHPILSPHGLSLPKTGAVLLTTMLADSQAPLVVVLPLVASRLITLPPES
jgi:hypothetical protein